MRVLKTFSSVPFLPKKTQPAGSKYAQFNDTEGLVGPAKSDASDNTLTSTVIEKKLNKIEKKKEKAINKAKARARSENDLHSDFDSEISAAPRPDYDRFRRASGTVDTFKATREHHIRYMGGVEGYTLQKRVDQYQNLSRDLIINVKKCSKSQTKFRELVLSTDFGNFEIMLRENLSSSKSKLLVSGRIFTGIHCSEIVACVSSNQAVIIYLNDLNSSTNNKCLIFYAKNAVAANIVVIQINKLRTSYSSSFTDSGLH